MAQPPAFVSSPTLGVSHGTASWSLAPLAQDLSPGEALAVWGGGGGGGLLWPDGLVGVPDLDGDGADELVTGISLAGGGGNDPCVISCLSG
jgi:hypothetical protein